MIEYFQQKNCSKSATFASILIHSELYRKTTGFLLLAAFVLQSFSQVLIFGDYFINTQKYAAQCINKDKVEMHCNGHCQMAKEMQQEQNHDKNTPQTNVSISVVYFIAGFSDAEIAVPVGVYKKEKFPFYQESAIFGQPQDILHPPVTA